MNKENAIISVVVLNWNSFDNTRESVDALVNGYREYVLRVIIVDNGSSELELVELREFVKAVPYFFLVENGCNLGFAGGVNAGIKKAQELGTDYILLLDNDAVVDTLCVSQLKHTMENKAKIGIAIATVYNYDNHNILQQAPASKVNFWLGDVLGMDGYSRFFGIKPKLTQISPFEISYAGFWCALFSSECVEKVGLFDEALFFTWEGVDYTERVKRTGYQVFCVPKAKVFHKWRTANKLDGRTEYYNPRNRFIVTKRYGSRLQYAIFLIWFFGIHFWLAISYYTIIKRRLDITKCFMEGTRDGFKYKGKGHE